MKSFKSFTEDLAENLQYRAKNGAQKDGTHEYIRRHYSTGGPEAEKGREYSEQQLDNDKDADAYADLGKNMTYAFYVLPSGHVYAYDVVGEWEGISHDKKSKADLAKDLNSIFGKALK